MARPSRNLDKKLLDAGRKLLPERGCTGLTLREVASKADVNLGMFSYYFKDREEFVRKVLEGVYGDFVKDLQISAGPGDPLEQLEAALLKVGRFTRDNRALILALFRDSLNQEKEVLAFLRTNFRRHFDVLAEILQAGMRAKKIRQVPLPLALSVIVGTMGVPHLLLETLHRVKAKRPFGVTYAELEQTLVSEDAIELRVEMVLRALAY